METIYTFNGEDITMLMCVVIREVIREIADLQVISVEDFKQRKMVIDTDLGQRIKELISDLEDLLEMYKQGLLRERLTDEKGNPFI